MTESLYLSFRLCIRCSAASRRAVGVNSQAARFVSRRFRPASLDSRKRSMAIEPVREQVFFSVLAAGDVNHPLPEIRVLSESRVEIVESGGKHTVVSINPEQPGDFVIDLGRVRKHALGAD